MKNALFLLILLIGGNCMAQKSRLTTQTNHSFFRSKLISTNRTENENPMMGRPNSNLKEKMAAAYSHPKLKSGNQSIDSVYMWRWDTNSADWALDYKYSVRQYDAKNNPLVELGQIWDGGSWVNSDQSINTYDDKNNLLTSDMADLDRNRLGERPKRQL